MRSGTRLNLRVQAPLQADFAVHRPLRTVLASRRNLRARTRRQALPSLTFLLLVWRRPVMVSIGMQHGTVHEMTQQTVYAQNRARQ